MNITRPTGLCMNGWKGVRAPGSGPLSRRSDAAWALPGIPWTRLCGSCAILLFGIIPFNLVTPLLLRRGKNEKVWNLFR